MVEITNGEIHMTRGDSAILNLSFRDRITFKPYEVKEGDKFIFTVKKTAEDETVLIQKTTTYPKPVIYIEPNDTQCLEFGEYEYDIKIITEAGFKSTPIGPKKFSVLREVGW